MAKFKVNQRVQYVGTSVPSLSGKFGLVVDPAGRNGWVIVEFENGEQIKCADISLIDANGIKPFRSGARDIIDTMSVPDLLHLIHKLAGTRHPVGVDEIQHAAKLIGERLASADSANDTVDALVQAERFISGFEDDETQEGIADTLAGLRAAIKREQAAPERWPDGSRETRMLDLIHKSLSAWEDEEDSVQEEHADLIEGLKSFVEGH